MLHFSFIVICYFQTPSYFFKLINRWHLFFSLAVLINCYPIIVNYWNHQKKVSWSKDCVMNSSFNTLLVEIFLSCCRIADKFGKLIFGQELLKAYLQWCHQIVVRHMYRVFLVLLMVVQWQHRIARYECCVGCMIICTECSRCQQQFHYTGITYISKSDDNCIADLCVQIDRCYFSFVSDHFCISLTAASGEYVVCACWCICALNVDSGGSSW